MLNRKEALELAVSWLTGPALVRDNVPVGEKGKKFNYATWNGAIRGEYNAGTRQWDSFCPVWHTGQAVKALVLAARALARPDLLESAGYCAAFVLDKQIRTGEDRGLILAFEDFPDLVNTSAVLETLDGLFLLSESTGNKVYQEAALAALDWVSRKCWDAGQGMFHDLYSFREHRLFHDDRLGRTRPLLDNAVFLKGAGLSGRNDFRAIAVATAETLLKTEDPSGNWINFAPCHADVGKLHPRQAYWWGDPMLEIYRSTGDKRFLDCFFRAAHWYCQALRRDGGLFRDTYRDFSTGSFGHSTSGSACAAIMFHRAYRVSGEAFWLEFENLALDFCLKMQFVRPDDPALRGAVLEKVAPPDGGDQSPFRLRDLGTIFTIQALAQ